jgi:trans-aconitate 2-methyltransferase
MTWSATQYVAFEAERTRPVRDLLSAVPDTEVGRAVDLGCGPGNSTEVLAARYPGAVISGLDSSPEMIEAARERLPRVRFDVVDIDRWSEPGPFDLILANAVLQWLPDHAALLPKLVAKLSSGGSLAIQVPDNLDEPAHREMRALAQTPAWNGRLGEVAQALREHHPPEWFYQQLRRTCERVDVWRTTYYHQMANHSALVDWFKGTGLRPFLGPLNDMERKTFLEQYEAALVNVYPAQADGTVLLRFPRLFVVATRESRDAAEC